VIALTSAHVDVWLVRSESVRDPGLLARFGDLLSAAERERMSALRGEDLRHQYLITRALIRTTLSRYDRVAPGCWQLSVNGQGRPEVVPGQSRLDLRFNVSHTAELIACAVTSGRSVGIDVERHDLRQPVQAIADRFLAPHEASDIAAQPTSQRVPRFFRYWTLRESYVKARGLGLASARPEFSFEIGDDIALQASDSTAWRFWQWQPSPRHTLAVTAACASHEPAHVRIHDIDALG
jgi:4'-phosphopantetheinyl transferase